jgi:hypothetical protein
MQKANAHVSTVLLRNQLPTRRGITAPHEAHSRARTVAQLKKHNAQTQKQAASTSNLGKK